MTSRLRSWQRFISGTGLIMCATAAALAQTEPAPTEESAPGEDAWVWSLRTTLRF
ncbi:MAG: hypothetical protein ABI537_14200 [Casimicrobiaceae bacterium]